MAVKSVASLKPVAFLLEVKNELSKVIWPTRNETIKMTVIVIAVSIAVGLFVGGLDYLLTKVTELLIKK